MWYSRKKAFLQSLLLLAVVILSILHPIWPDKQTKVAAASPQTSFGYGIIAGENNYNLVEAMGFNWIKINLSWKTVEGTRGGPYDWSSSDAAVNTARSKGFAILMRIDDSPQWASGSSQFNAPPIDDNDLADFAYQVALHYRGQVQAYEIWNEPNLSVEWGNQPPNPIKYGQMLQALYPRVKQADPNALVITGGLSTTGDIGSLYVYSDIEYIARLYDPNMDGDPSDGFKGYFDAIGSHPYGGPYPPDQDPWNPPNMGTYFRRAWQQHQMAQVWGHEDRQVWATEFGYLLNPATDGLSCDLGSHFDQMEVSEQQQADYLVAAYQYAKANWPWMGPMFLMTLDSSMDSYRPPCDTMRFWAILRSDGSPRLAYTKLASMTAAMSPALALSTTQIYAMVRPSEPNAITQQVSISNSGAWSLSWNATPSAGWISVSSASGLAPSVLTITMDKTGLPLGWTTGTVTINSNGGSQTITLHLYIGNVQRVYLPTISSQSN